MQWYRSGVSGQVPTRRTPSVSMTCISEHIPAAAHFYANCNDRLVYHLDRPFSRRARPKRRWAPSRESHTRQMKLTSFFSIRMTDVKNDLKEKAKELQTPPSARVIRGVACRNVGQSPLVFTYSSSLSPEPEGSHPCRELIAVLPPCNWY